MKRLFVLIALLLALTALPAYADDGGGMAKPPTTDRELTTVR